jgi:hypothetical protein
VKRFAGLALLLVVIALAGAATYAARERRQWAEHWALATAAEMGVGPVSLEVVELGFEGAQIRQVEIGEPPTLRIERLDFRWTPREIVRLQIARLTLTGARLEAAITDSGELSFGALDPALGSEGDGSFALPLEVVVTDASVELATPLGAVFFDGIDGRVTPDSSRLGTGELRAEIHDQVTPNRFAPLQLEMRAAPHGERGLALELEVEAAGGGVHVSGTGSLIPAEGSGKLTLVLAPVALGPDGLSLQALSPAFAALLPAASGGMSGRLDVEVSAEPSAAYSVSGELALEDLSLERSGTRIEGLSGRIRFAGPDPWRTPGIQTVRFGLLDLVGALRDGTIRFAARGSEVHLDSFEAGWAGGRIATRGRFDPVNQNGGLTVEVTRIDLELLLKELDIADLTGTGHLSGAVPVVLAEGSLRVSAALAASAEGGVIHWQPAAGAAKRFGLAGDLALVADALEDYHYEELMIGLQGDLAGDVVMRLGLKGSNPAYEGGRPVHLNLEVEMNVPATLLASSAVSRMPEALERKLRERVRSR